MPLCCNGDPLLCARMAAIESVDHLGRKLWSCPAARPFHSPLEAGGPGVRLPAQGAGHPGGPGVLEPPPAAPPRPRPRVLPPSPAVPPLTPQAPGQPPRIAPGPMEPPLGQGAGRFRPPRVDIAPTRPAFYRACHVPAPPGPRQARLGSEPRRRQRGQAHDPASPKEARGGPFLCPCRPWGRARLACATFKR